MTRPRQTPVYEDGARRTPGKIIAHVWLRLTEDYSSSQTWEVTTGPGEVLGTLTKSQHRPTRMSRPSDLRRAHRVDLAPRTAWTAHRADGQSRARLTTRNEALLTLLGD